MNIEITINNDRPVLSRKEIEAKLSFEGTTPSRNEVVKEVAKKTGAKEELVVVREIKTSFGETTAKVTAFVYTDAKVMKDVEGKHMAKRHEVPEKPAAEATPAAAPAETPVEPAAEEAPAAEAPAEEKAE